MNRFAILVCALVVVGAVQAEESKPTLADLAWIAGCWESLGQGSWFQEQWMSPNGGTMLGMSRTVRDDSTLAYEFLRIHQESDGIYYTSNPSGQEQASFKLVKVEAQKVEFENPDHDFPQKITYELDQKGNLNATISGHDKGAYKRVNFPMLKAKCN
jgi:hypothetical protein